MKNYLEFDKDDISAFDAISEAQRIAFAPMIFQATICLRDFGILTFLDTHTKDGATLAEICQFIELNEYSISLLLDIGLTNQLVYKKEGRFYLGKIGYFFLHDEMTRVNTNFTQHVCYEGLFSLKESMENMKPIGLNVFGEWETIYPYLNQLPEPAKTSWFEFDHHYSSSAFKSAIRIISEYNPALLYDVGGNTGKWALICCEYNPNLAVKILDLPEQIALMNANISQTPYHSRISGEGINMLGNESLPTQTDIWWMSQFLDCFTPEQVVSILKKIHNAMKDDAKIAIMELFWDRQSYKIGAYSLNATSLYFTCMANGNSRFYGFNEFVELLHAAGLVIERTEHNLGVGHTLLICTKA